MEGAATRAVPIYDVEALANKGVVQDFAGFFKS
jgi:hypothetical protein